MQVHSSHERGLAHAGKRKVLGSGINLDTADRQPLDQVALREKTKSRVGMNMITPAAVIDPQSTPYSRTNFVQS